MRHPVIDPHPALLLSLASVAISVGAGPMCWAVDTRLGPTQPLLFVSLTVLAMLLALAAIRTMFLVNWKDKTHPAVLMGIVAIAVGMTAVPLRCAGHTEQVPPHPMAFVVIALLTLVFASSCAATAFGRMIPDRLEMWHLSVRLSPQEIGLQAFPQNLDPDALDDIANTYEGVWLAIAAAHSAGTCTRKLIRAQTSQLMELAERVKILPTADAIRADADVFNRRARRAARSSDSAPARYIRSQCHLRFAAAATIANHRRGR